ncbi:MAG: alpha/beta fold hydrolase [Rubrivivax sp.]
MALIGGAAMLPTAADAADPANYPAPQQGSWTARDFRFHDGRVLPEVRLHYRTVGDPAGEPVLVLHGTAGSGASMLSADFAGQLFGPGQPLDARRYYLILPDALGAGQSAKPSDGLRADFPAYNYADMVSAQHRLVTEGLGVRHLRLVIGNSMGGMQAWMWAQQWPAMMDAVVPMACQPTAMSGRNWMLRRLLTQAIRNDPQWRQGNYSQQPPAMQTHLTTFALASSGGNQALQRQAPTAKAADSLIAARLAAPFNGDANDVLYQWESSADYDASANLEKIEASVLVINAADDERNPPELRVLERELPRVKNARVLLIPGSPTTSGHGTTGQARLYAAELADLLQRAPRR